MARHVAATVILELLVDILQAGGDSLARRYREAEPHRLPVIVVGVLPQDHHPCLVNGTPVQRSEDSNESSTASR